MPKYFRSSLTSGQTKIYTNIFNIYSLLEGTAASVCPWNKNNNGNHRRTQGGVLIGFAKSMQERAQSDWSRKAHHKMTSRLVGGLLFCVKFLVAFYLKKLSVLILCAPAFIFIPDSSALLGRPRCGLSIWLSLLVIFNTLFWVYANVFPEKMADKTRKSTQSPLRRKWPPTVTRRAKH